MRNLLKDRRLWIIVALILVFAVYTYYQDYGNVSWLPSDESEPLVDTVIDLIFFVNIVNLGAFWFGRRGGIIAVIPALLIVAWCHADDLVSINAMAYLLFAMILGLAIANIVSRYVETSRNYKKALEEVKTLSGLLPICGWCKKIRDDKGYWTEVASYLGEHAGTEFTHGMCPECFERLSKEHNLS